MLPFGKVMVYLSFIRNMNARGLSANCVHNGIR